MKFNKVPSSIENVDNLSYGLWYRNTSPGKFELIKIEIVIKKATYHKTAVLLPDQVTDIDIAPMVQSGNMTKTQLLALQPSFDKTATEANLRWIAGDFPLADFVAYHKVRTAMSSGELDLGNSLSKKTWYQEAWLWLKVIVQIQIPVRFGGTKGL